MMTPKHTTDASAGADVGEAIAALAKLKCVSCVDLGDDCPHVTVRSFLESVAQERADRLTLEEWVRAKNQHDAYVVALPKGYRATADDGVGPIREFDAPTRAGALSKAATFCRAEMGSKT